MVKVVHVDMADVEQYVSREELSGWPQGIAYTPRPASRKPENRHPSHSSKERDNVEEEK